MRMIIIWHIFASVLGIVGRKKKNDAETKSSIIIWKSHETALMSTFTQTLRQGWF